MTKNEAINILEERYIHNSTGEDDDFAIAVNTAIDMAIEALQREEAEEKGYCHRIKPKGGDTE